MQKFELLLKAVQDNNLSPRRMMWLSFLRGIFFGLGSTIGVAIIVGFATYILNRLAQIPELHGIIDWVQIQKLLKRN